MALPSSSSGGMAETNKQWLLDFLAYDSAKFIYAFLLATGNHVSPQDRSIRDGLKQAILGVLAAHGIDEKTFGVWPDIAAPGRA